MMDEKRIKYLMDYFGMTEAQANVYWRIEGLPLCYWPKEFQDYFMPIQKRFGFSGDVLMQSLANWLKETWHENMDK